MKTSTQELLGSSLHSDSKDIFLSLEKARLLLEDLFNSDSPVIPAEELESDILEIVKMSEAIKQSDSELNKLKLFDAFHQLSKRIRIRYSDFFEEDVFKQFELEELKIDGFKKIMAAQALMMLAYEENNGEMPNITALWTGATRLANAIENFRGSFSSGAVFHMRNIASAVLDDRSIFPDEALHPPQVFHILVSIRNTAKAISWMMTEQEEKRLREETKTSLNQVPAPSQEQQKHENKAAIEWATARLQNG